MIDVMQDATSGARRREETRHNKMARRLFTYSTGTHNVMNNEADECKSITHHQPTPIEH